MQSDRITGNLLQAYTTNGAHLCSEVPSQQIFAQSDALENLRTTIAADGADTHLRHNFLQSLIHSLDVVGFSRRVVLLNLAAFHQIIENGKRHVRTQCAGTITQQQGGVHHLANLTALHNQGRLHTLTHANQIVVNSTYSQQ